MEHLIPSKAAAKRLGISAQTLERWRARGYGPPYTRSGRGHVYYSAEDLAAWLNPAGLTKTGSDRLISTKEASRQLGLHYRTLANWRHQGRGPPYFKFGTGRTSVVRYREGDLATWRQGFTEEKMAHDRDYYRCLDDKRLIEEAKHNPNTELCIALAERLEDTAYGQHHD